MKFGMVRAGIDPLCFIINHLSLMSNFAAGGEELAILIFLVSFAWPYMKQIITLGLWFAPPKLVSVERRGTVFLWLDALAKWSFADIFVLILTIVSFRVSVKRLVDPPCCALEFILVSKNYFALQPTERTFAPWFLFT